MSDPSRQRPFSQKSLPDQYFDDIYREKDDPWDFETSAYEAAKYDETIGALPRASYENALEIGCSIGVLTEKLAAKCGRLLSIDVSERALERARRRCQNLPQVRFARRRVPEQFPDETFDLIVVSEVGYYLSFQDLRRLRTLVVERLNQNAHLLLIHWTPEVDDYPLTGDQVHDFFLELTGRGTSADVPAPPVLRHLSGRRAELYRIDLFCRDR